MKGILVLFLPLEILVLLTWLYYPFLDLPLACQYGCFQPLWFKIDRDRGIDREGERDREIDRKGERDRETVGERVGERGEEGGGERG